MDVEIIDGHISKNHLHLLMSVPPHLSVSKLVQRLKGKTSRKPLSEYKRLVSPVWGRHLWARGYFVASSGSITGEVIAEYIEMREVIHR